MSKVANKKDLIERLLSNKALLLECGVKRLGIFGSFVKDVPLDGSDVDLVVEFVVGKKTFKNFMALSFNLEEILGRPVEILTDKSMSPYIGPKIMQEIEYVIAA